MRKPCSTRPSYPKAIRKLTKSYPRAIQTVRSPPTTCPSYPKAIRKVNKKLSASYPNRAQAL